MVDKVYLPSNFSLESEFRAGGWDTEVVKLKSGKDQRVSFSPIPQRTYTVSYNAISKADSDTIAAFFEDRQGMLLPFLAKDYTDFELTNEVILTASGGETTAQIIQTVGTSNPLVRTIRYIDDATLVVKKDGVTLTLTTDYSVSASALITFVAPLVAAEVITVTCEFFTPVTFETDEISRVAVVPGADIQQIKSIPLAEYIE